MMIGLPLGLAACAEVVDRDVGEARDAQQVEGFGTPARWSDYFCTSSETCAVGDVNGDGRADVIAFTRDPADDVWVGLAAANAFSAPRRMSDYFCVTGEECRVADVNGDGLADLVAFNHGVNGGTAVWVSLSVGNGFMAPQKWSDYFCTGTETCAMGDVDGDGKADIIAFTRGPNNQVWVGLSSGSAFGAPQKWSDYFCVTGEECQVADVNGDGMADLIAFNHGINGGTAVWIGRSSGTAFNAPEQWSDYFCLGSETCAVGDVNGDGLADIIAFTRDPNDDVFVGLSSGRNFAAPEQWSDFFCRTGEVCAVADVNADGNADVIAWNHGLGGANAVYVGLAYSFWLPD